MSWLAPTVRTRRQCGLPVTWASSDHQVAFPVFRALCKDVTLKGARSSGKVGDTELPVLFRFLKWSEGGPCIES